MEIQNMTSKRSGRVVANQFEIFTDKGKYFQSYSTMIAFKSFDGKIQLDIDNHDYSHTTIKYRNQFLGMTSKEVNQAIKNGDIKLINLNL